MEGWVLASRDEFAAGRWAEALAPTRALVERFPTQQVYSDRLARIYFHLGKPADEAAAWEQFVKSSPTPEDACPALAQAYLRAGDRDAVDAGLRALPRLRSHERRGVVLPRPGLPARPPSRTTPSDVPRGGPHRSLAPDSRVGLAAALLAPATRDEALESFDPAVERDTRQR